MKSIHLIAVLATAIVITSCQKEEIESKDHEKFSFSFYLNNNPIQYTNTLSHKLEVSAISSSGSGHGQHFIIKILVGNFIEDNFPYTNCLVIELANKFQSNLSNGTLDEAQFHNLLSKRDLTFSETWNWINNEKEGVTITYFDHTGEAWTTSDFTNKFPGGIKVEPTLDYNSFSFKIIDSKKANYPKFGPSAKGFAAELTILFDCELVNSNGIKKKLTFGTGEFTALYAK